MKISSIDLSASPPDWAPASCTLPTAEQPLRMAEFDRLFAEAVREVQRLAPTSLDLVLVALARHRAAELARRETQCCSFFTFTIREDVQDGAPRERMNVTVPPTHVDVLDGLAARSV